MTTEIDTLIAEMADAPEDREGLIQWHVDRGMDRKRAEQAADELLAGHREDAD